MKTTDISSQIEELLTQRQRHTDALAAINQTLDNIASMIGDNGQKVGRATPAPAPESPAMAPARRRRRRRFDMTAEEFVLAIVKQHRNPMTRDVNAAWKEAGRPFTADIALSSLVKKKKMKRTSLVGERGSRYALL